MVPDDATWGMSSVALVDWLTHRGEITNDEADRLRPLPRHRLEAAHGGLDPRVSREEIAFLEEATDEMLRVRSSSAPPEG